MDLHSSVSELSGVGDIVKRRLEKLDIFTIEDLLYHIPHRYEDYRRILKAKSTPVGEPVTIKATVTNTANVRSKTGKRMFVAEAEDNSGKIKVVWFFQPYLYSIIKRGHEYLFSGTAEWMGKERALISPQYFEIDEGFDIKNINLIFPIYPETKGLSSKWFRRKIPDLIIQYPDFLNEFLPEDILGGLPAFNAALSEIHSPTALSETDKYRERLAFNELLKLFLANQKRKESWQTYKAIAKINASKKLSEAYRNNLPFDLTKSQKDAIDEIYHDLASDLPMNRLLEGDVGSGKTAVAAAACYAAFVNGYRCAIMAPTQILALQHYKTLQEIFSGLQIRISLLSGSITRQAVGKTDIYVGTHAILHRKVDFSDIALVVIDEQHRFGVEQRTHLITKSGKRKKIPHILTMTATPIPRTVAMTLYGDLNLSILSEMPKGRIPITTWTVPPAKRQGAYKWISDQISKDHVQVFIICPLIEDSEVETMKDVKSVKAEFEHVKTIFPHLNVGLLHGKLKSQEKEAIITKFKEKQIDILVSTSVIEVGIDVANATIIVIEGAERFGLAQLHQLRGRVGRGDKKSYCLLFTQSRSTNIIQRLAALKKARSGFELAELDLKLRGPGQIFGTSQSGFSRLKVANWSNFDLIKRAKEVSEKIKMDKEIYNKVLGYFWGNNEVLN